jgi:transposase
MVSEESVHEGEQMGFIFGRQLLDIVNARLKDHVKPKNRMRLPDLIDVSWQPAKVSVMLDQKEELSSPRDKKLLRGLIRKSAVIAMASKLAKEFRVMMETRQGSQLKEWVDKVQLSDVHELKGFAKSLLNDYQAVKNALTLPWSNGPVEGQINKLKTIKRQMYGHAGFDLLRKKVIFGYG